MNRKGTTQLQTEERAAGKHISATMTPSKTNVSRAALVVAAAVVVLALSAVVIASTSQRVGRVALASKPLVGQARVQALAGPNAVCYTHGPLRFPTMRIILLVICLNTACHALSGRCCS